MTRQTGRAGFAYQPALDGVRALSVVAVLLFHGGVTGFGGGYLGVSVFFTLSGFLIATLMLAERERTGRLAIGAFYVRRAKRLLPASVLCIAAIAVLAGVTDWFEGAAALRRDLIGALLQVANWVFLAGGGSYQELLAQTAGQASPVEHYWSLAIEEQFYWLFPLAFVGLHRVVRTHRGATMVIAVATALFAVAAPAIATVWGPDAAYWATPARAAEILVGVLAAFVLHGREVPRRWSLVAPPALLVLAVAVVLFPSDHGPAYEGALPLVGVVSVLLIVGLQAPGVSRRALGARPLAALGRISYGVYLFHWPVYVVLDEERTELGPAALLAVRLAVTLAIALVSYRAIERPVRERVRWRPARTGAVALAATVAALVAIVVVVEPGPGNYWRSPEAAQAAEIDAAPDDGTLPPLVATSATATTSPTTTPTPTTMPTPTTTGSARDSTPDLTTAPTTASTTEPPLPQLARPMRVVVAGDSTAEATGFGLAQWAVERPELAQVSILAAQGCGFLRDGEMDAGGWTSWPDRCARWLDDELPARTAELRPDVVMMMTTSWDVLDRRWTGETTSTPFDAEYRERLTTDFAAITDALLRSGAGHVVFVREPVPVPLWGFGGEQAQSDPGRHDVIAEVMAVIAAERPGDVSVVDLAGWLEQVGLSEDRDARPDGIHWSAEAARRIAVDFLGERLLRAALGV